MKEEKKFLIPEAQIVEFLTEDIILTSDLDEFNDEQTEWN